MSISVEGGGGKGGRGRGEGEERKTTFGVSEEKNEPQLVFFWGGETMVVVVGTHFLHVCLLWF